jgi:hypothetical protein
MPGYIHADTPHERTVQKPGDLYGCNSVVTGDSSPRGSPTTITVQDGWYETVIEGQPVRLALYRPHTTHWIKKLCATEYPPVMGPCAGCANRIEEQPNGNP